MTDEEIYHVGWNGKTFQCPNCYRDVRPPFGGHTWTCHEEYGGCGWAFKSVKALKRVDNNET